jgi:ADP-heptose:LPS heptosyltransferase
MIYYIIFLLLYPLFYLCSFFRSTHRENLVIQTAKIGDYVNTTIMINELQKCDIIADKVNYPLVKNEIRVDKTFLIQEYKQKKLTLLWKIFRYNYENIYVLVPNSFNTFIAALSFAQNKVILHTYATKWYVKLLSKNFTIIQHTKDDLTLQSYLNMINSKLTYLEGQKTLPKIDISKIILEQNFKVGLSLSAGNKLKTIDIQTWLKIFSILRKLNCSIYIFGLKEEEKELEKFKNVHDLSRLKIVPLFGKLQLEELPYYISQMNLYISSDTGNSYMADTFNIPLINFAGPCYMQEQRPVNKDVLIVKSNAKDVPFSFIFQAPYEGNKKDLYTITEQQEAEIRNFILKYYKEFQSSE